MELLEGKSYEVAPRLLGSILEREIGDKIIRARIVETEAYDETDAASHSFNGITPRSEVMFGPAGRLYVYFTYGMHYCCNVVVGEKGTGAAVLIRAVEPIEGIEEMEKLRVKSGYDLSNGPAKLCQAMGIDKRLNGHESTKSPLKLLITPPLREEEITTTTRIGIKQATDKPWRFFITGNPYVSRP